MFFPTSKVTLLVALIALSACSKYALTVNEAVVYQPAPLFKEYTLADKNLRQCVEQTIIDRKITAANQLKTLVCTSAGIQNLQGLAVFNLLQELNLKSNALTSLEGISTLTKLKILDASDNQIIDGQALLTLPNLAQLDLEDNAAMRCDDLKQFAQFNQGEYHFPQHCR